MINFSDEDLKRLIMELRMNKLYLALIANLIASVFAFFQIQGHYVWDKPWLKSIWFIYGTSMFIALYIGILLSGLLNTLVLYGI